MMGFNKCKTCGAGEARAGLLINDECLNCHDTRKTGAFTLHAELSRTDIEIGATLLIIHGQPTRTKQ
jgi:hypothetical protein